MPGGEQGAIAGTLTYMVGCPEDLRGSVQAVIERMGSRMLYFGSLGSGIKAKLANNYIPALTNIATAEALNMGVRWGLDAKLLGDLINTSTGRCWPNNVNNPVPGVDDAAPASRDYKSGFRLALMAKDLNLALEAAASYDIPSFLGRHAAKVHGDIAEKEEEFAQRDFSIVYKYLSKRTHVDLGLR